MEDDTVEGETTVVITPAGSTPVGCGLALLGAEGPASAVPLAGLLEDDACSNGTPLLTRRLGPAAGAGTG